MADREEKPPPSAPASGLSAEEADRLSERYKPSWDAGEGADAPPRDPAPRKHPKQTLLGLAPVTPPASPPDDARAGSDRPSAKQTLVGLSPPRDAAGSEPASEAPSAISVRPAPGATGIAKPYRPKDDPAGPAIVLTDEVAKTEAEKTAEIEARRAREVSMRRMQTVMNMKAPDFSVVKPKRRSNGALRLAIGALALAVVVFVVVKLSIRQESTPPEPSVAPAAAPEARTEPVVEPAPPAANEPPTVEPAGSVETPPPLEALDADATEERAAPAIRPAPRPKQAAANPAPRSVSTAAPKPTSGTAGSAKKSGVIVRDTPF